MNERLLYGIPVALGASALLVWRVASGTEASPPVQPQAPVAAGPSQGGTNPDAPGNAVPIDGQLPRPLAKILDLGLPVYCGAGTKPMVALTFDDGPHGTNTPRLLDMLKERNIKATFFVVGPNARRYPGIMKRMVAEGHEIGNHTMTHGNLAKMSNASIKRELDGCRDAIIQSCGVNPRVMRAPYGALKSAQKIYIKDTWGYPNIHWSVDPEDWKRPGPSVVANRITSRTQAGGIVLVHDIHAPSVVAMPQALDGLLRKGFRFVTTSQLISLGNRTASAETVPDATASAAPAEVDAAEGEPIPAIPLPSTREVSGENHARIEE